MLTKRGRRRSDACDVIVVGAGLVGAAVAARLTREGLDTAILEARRVTGGATGRSLGMVLLGLPGHYSWAVSVYGRQQAREIWALTARGRARLVETARRLQVPFRRTGSLALAVDDEEADTLWESVKLLQDDGFDASFTLTDPLNRGFQAALRRPDDVAVNATALTRALLDAEGVMVHEGTEVYALEPTRDGIRVWAHGRTVVCSAVVLAVNGYAALVDPYLAENVTPVPCSVFVTGPLDDPFPDRLCTIDAGRGSLRALPDGRLLLGTWQRLASPATGEPSQGRLMDVVARRFPELDLKSADRWSEVMGFTPDGLPLLGRLPSLPQAYFAVGFGGRGLSWAFVAAERLVNAMLHDAELGLLSSRRLTGS
jgi:glycine/D-amino acid oxidase-like deaminating enzyme